MSGILLRDTFIVHKITHALIKTVSIGRNRKIDVEMEIKRKSEMYIYTEA